MANVGMSCELPVSAQQVWATIGGFNALAQWHPLVTKSEESEDDGATLRTLTLGDGSLLVERLEEIDDGDRLYTYSIQSGPVPVSNYTSTLRVTENGSGCSVSWSSEFEADGASENDAVKVVQGIYEAGFDNLRKMFGG